MEVGVVDGGKVRASCAPDWTQSGHLLLSYHHHLVLALDDTPT